MDTGAISYRVADFLKQHPPFQVMEQADLMELASAGRVKFHEIDEFILWQNAGFSPWVFVIQQGTVGIWREEDDQERMVDIRGAGDVVGIDRYHGFTHNEHSAKAASDVVLYALPAEKFGEMLNKYPQAEKYIAAHASVAGNYLITDQRGGADEIFVFDSLPFEIPPACNSEVSMQTVAKMMLRDGTSAVPIVGDGHQLQGVLTTTDLVRALADTDFSPAQPVSRWMRKNAPVLEPSATVADCVLSIAERDSEVAVITARDSNNQDQHRVIDLFDLSPAFGDQPVEILREIKFAPSVWAIRSIHQRARTFALERLLSPGRSDWLAIYLHRVDIAIVRRIAELMPPPSSNYCWSVFGSAGRRELMAAMLPRAILLVPDDADREKFPEWFTAMNQALVEAGYIERPLHFAAEYACASVEEWSDRYYGWISDPVGHQIQRARHMFDLRGIHGRLELWDELYQNVRLALKRSDTFLRLMAHDCLSSLPPLTFFRDAVVEKSGERKEVFELQRSALRPLVDVGRVYGIATGNTLGTSTLDRFRFARTLLPAQEAIFREAADTLRVVLYQQARNGIRLGNSGSRLDPSLLSHHERQVLKSGFRSILRLLEFTADGEWMQSA